MTITDPQGRLDLSALNRCSMKRLIELAEERSFEFMEGAFGFLRQSDDSFLPSWADIYVNSWRSFSP